MSISIPGSLIAKGRTAEVYTWQEGQILKLFYDGCPPSWTQHEIDIGRVVATLILPTPKLIDIVKIEGRQGIIYERVDGPTMLKLSNTKPWLLFHLARQLAELHTQMHKQDGAGLAPLRSSLKTTIQQVENLSPSLKAGVLRMLERLPDESALCHFDFHPGQVIITARGPVIIDWMTAVQGHPLADVARTSIILMVGQVPGAGWAMRAIVNLWKGLFYQTYIARYLELHPGVTRDDVTTWMVPVAAGRLNEGITVEQEPLLRFIASNLLF
jgi:aminoglycoside phosphotransferase (APT) family kinase protein